MDFNNEELSFEEKDQAEDVRSRIQNAIDAMLLEGGVVGYDAVTGLPVVGKPIIDVSSQKSNYEWAQARAALLDEATISGYINTINNQGYDDATVATAKSNLDALIAEWQQKGFIDASITKESFLGDVDNSALLLEIREKYRQAAIDEFKLQVKTGAETAFDAEIQGFNDSIAKARAFSLDSTEGVEELRAKIEDWKTRGIISEATANSIAEKINSGEINDPSRSNEIIAAMLVEAKSNTGIIAVNLITPNLIADVETAAKAVFDSEKISFEANLNYVNNEGVTDAELLNAHVQLDNMIVSYNSFRANDSGFIQIASGDYTDLLARSTSDDQSLANAKEIYDTAMTPINSLHDLFDPKSRYGSYLSQEELLAIDGPADFKKVLERMADEGIIDRGIIDGLVYRFANSAADSYAFSNGELEYTGTEYYEHMMAVNYQQSITDYENMFKIDTPLNRAITELVERGRVARELSEEQANFEANYLRIMLHSGESGFITPKELEERIKSLKPVVDEQGNERRLVSPAAMEELLEIYNDKHFRMMKGIDQYDTLGTANAEGVSEEQGLVDADVSAPLSAPATVNVEFGTALAGAGASRDI